jgi:hypothetical protein
LAARAAAVAAVGSLLLVACGSQSGPRLTHADGTQLIALTDRIAAHGSCKPRRRSALTARAIELVNSGRVPSGLQEPLLARVNALAEDTPACTRARELHAWLARHSR